MKMQKAINPDTLTPVVSCPKIKFNLEIEMPERWAKKFIQMLDCMRWCSKVGASRTVGFYADGDGDFSGFDFKIEGNPVGKLQNWEKIDNVMLSDKTCLTEFHHRRPINFFFDAG